MLFEAKNGRSVHGVVGANAFEGTAAIVQRMGQHVDLGVAPIDHLAVHPDLAVTVGHRGNYGAHGIPLVAVGRKTGILRGRSGPGTGAPGCSAANGAPPRARACAAVSLGGEWRPLRPPAAPASISPICHCETRR